MYFVLGLIAILMIDVLPNLFSTYLFLRNPEYQNQRQTSVTETIFRRWFNDITSIAIVLMIAYQQPNGIASVGIQAGRFSDNLVAIFIGIAGLGWFLIIFALAERIIMPILKKPVPPSVDTSNPLVIDSLRFRDKWERLANLTILPFSAISEDLIYRGYLILLLGEMTNTYIPWAIISIFFMVIIHLYQGRNIRMILFHLFSAFVFVVITISTKNILAPISAHLYSDYMQRIRLWRFAETEDGIASVTHSNKMKFVYAFFILFNVVVLFAVGIMVIV